MSESVPVRCPACLRVHAFTPPTFPCPCGSPLVMPVRPGGGPAQLEHRTGKTSWVPLICPACPQQNDGPHPELDCPGGGVLPPPVGEATPSSPGRDAGPAPAPAAS